MDGGPWEATVHGVAKSRTRLSDFTIASLENLVQLYVDPNVHPKVLAEE